MLFLMFDKTDIIKSSVVGGAISDSDKNSEPSDEDYAPLSPDSPLPEAANGLLNSSYNSYTSLI